MKKEIMGNKWLKVINEENGRFWIIERKTKDCLAALDTKAEAQMYLDGYRAGRIK